MKCLKCNHEQDTGKFCGKCGTKFEEVVTNNEEIVEVTTQVPEDVPVEETTPVNEVPVVKNEEQVEQVFQEQTSTTVEQPIPPTQPAPPAEPNVHVETVKAKSKMYFNYFMHYLKKPSLVHNRGEAEFSNGLISMFVLAALIAFTLYASVNSFTRSAFDMGPGFIQLFLSVVVFVIVLLGLVSVSLFITSKFFGPDLSFKTIISIYGAHLGPSIIIAAVAFIFILVKSFTFGGLALSLALIFSVTLLPFYIISVLLTKKATSFDPLYGYIIYIVIVSVVFFIFMTIMADSSIGNYIQNFDDFLY